MVDINQYVPLINPKVIGDSPADVERFRATQNNFANRQSSNPKEFASNDDDYECCPNCSRRFFSGRLQLHLKSCKDGKPLKPIKVKPQLQEATTLFTQDNFQTPNRPTASFFDDRDNQHYENHQKPNDAAVFREKSPNIAASKVPPAKFEQDATFRGFNAKENDYNISPIKGKPPHEELQKQEAFADNYPESPKYEDNMYEAPQQEGGQDGRVACGVCSRMFQEDRVEKHEKACKKSNKKRPVFDTTKQRAVLENGETLPIKTEAGKPKKVPIKATKEKEKEKERQPEDSPKQEAKPKKVPKWKAEHENFIENLRFNKQLKEMEKRGEDTRHLVAPTIVNDSYVSCPHCFRKFAPATADRHIPKCKDTFNRPKPPKRLLLDKIDPSLKTDKSKTLINPKKDPIKDMLDQPKSATTPKLQPLSYEKLESTRTPSSNFSTGNYEQQRDETLMSKLSPKESSRVAALSQTDTKALLKRTNTFGNAGKQALLPDIRRPELTEESSAGYDISLSAKKTREMRSQSPSNLKKVFTEAMPKKEDLLQNYQGILARSSTYATKECPNCCRTFATGAAERHIPVCKDIKGRPLKNTLDHDGMNEDARKTKMLLTSLGMKGTFRKKNEEGDSKQQNQQGFASTQSDQTKSYKRQVVGSAETGEYNPAKSSFTKKNPAATVGGACFCTSCGVKVERVHRFCGFCGQKRYM